MWTIEYPSETDDIVIRRITQMLGIRRVTICLQEKKCNDYKIYIVLIAKQAKNKSSIIANT